MNQSQGSAQPLPWDQTRWRDAAASPNPYGLQREQPQYLNHHQHPNQALHGPPPQQQQHQHTPPPQRSSSHGHSYESAYPTNAQPQLSAPTAVNPSPYRASVLDQSQQAWQQDRPRSDHRPASRKATRALDWIPPIDKQRSPYHPHSAGGMAIDHQQQQHTKQSNNRDSYDQSRNSHQINRYPSSGHGAHSPLTVHIPQSNTGINRLSPISTAAPSDSHSANGMSITQTPPTSLPSFKSLRDHVPRDHEANSAHGATAPPYSTCRTCESCRPMLPDLMAATTDLDEVLQAFSSKVVPRPRPNPHESSVRTIQWIIDTLRSLKHEMYDAAQQSRPGYSPQGTSRDRSPVNPLKRSWDREDSYGVKRPRSGGSLDYALGLAPRDDRRGSGEFSSRELGYLTGTAAQTPPHTDSMPNSAGSKPVSPATTNRGLIVTSDPATSHAVFASNNANAQRLTDLQQQLNMKTLKLETLEGEYATLLQRLQRERVKSQTIEKKTNVADQEVNDLSSRNEELADQVKSLEARLEDSEKRREVEREDAARDKEQWGRMLEMSGRLQARTADEKQKLLDEKAYLTRRIAFYEDEDSARFDSIKTDLTARRDGSEDRARDLADCLTKTSNPGANDEERNSRRVDGAMTFADADSGELHREISTLRTRIEVLRQALREVKRQSVEAESQARKSSKRIESEVDRALQDTGAKIAHKQLFSEQPRQADRRSDAISGPASSTAQATPIAASSEPATDVANSGYSSNSASGTAVARSAGVMVSDAISPIPAQEQMNRTMHPTARASPTISAQPPMAQHPSPVSAASSTTNSKDISTSRWVEATDSALSLPNPQPHYGREPRFSPNHHDARDHASVMRSSPVDMLDQASSTGSHVGTRDDHYPGPESFRPSAMPPLRVQAAVTLPPFHTLSPLDPKRDYF